MRVLVVLRVLVQAPEGFEDCGGSEVHGPVLGFECSEDPGCCVGFEGPGGSDSSGASEGPERSDLGAFQLLGALQILRAPRLQRPTSPPQAPQRPQNLQKLQEP